MEILEKYKIYEPTHNTDSNSRNIIGIPYHSSWFFELEPDRFVLTKNLEDSDIVPIFSHVFIDDIDDETKTILKDKIILGLGIFHSDNDQLMFNSPFTKGWQKFTEKFLITETNLVNVNNKVVNYDMVWNRSKLYFTEYNRINLSVPFRVWTHNSTEKMFSLTAIQKTNSAKRFLCPNRIQYNREPLEDKKRQYYRQKLHDYIKDTDNIFSDWTSVPPKILDSEERIFENSETYLTKSLWLPVSNKLYSDTFISVYIETLVNSFDTKIVSEKTFDPLIKGHFILPFGYHGLIQDIKKYGFELPSWINYEYDTEINPEKRFDLFMQELKRLQSMEIKHYYELFEKDFELLVHNRNVFFTRPYDLFYPSLTRALSYV